MQVLGLPRAGIDDDFFAVGGHSLLAVQLMAGIDDTFGRQLSLATLLEAGTIRNLSRRSMSRARPLRGSRWSRSSRGVPHPPFFCVHGVGGEVLIYSGAGRTVRARPAVCRYSRAVL